VQEGGLKNREQNTLSMKKEKKEREGKAKTRADPLFWGQGRIGKETEGGGVASKREEIARRAG